MHKPKAESVALPPVPDSLATPEFLKTWSDWQAARRTMKPSVPITPIAAAEQFRILVPLGPDRAIEAIRTSIANGWRGLFPAKASSAPADPDAFVRKPHDDDEVDQIMGWPKGTSKLGAEFAPTWKRWNEHLAELNRPMTTAATERQMAEFAAWGTERAVAAINHSITKNWSSIHEPKGANNGSEKHGTRTIVENLQL